MSGVKRSYFKQDYSSGYPAGEKIFYECTSCGDVIPSMPVHAMACKCRNVIVDSDAGRISVRDASAFRIFSE